MTPIATTDLYIAVNEISHSTNEHSFEISQNSCLWVIWVKLYWPIVYLNALLIFIVAEFNNVMNGLKTAGEMIEHARTFMKNTKTVDIMKTTKVPYHVSLAASYGNLNSETIKALDEKLKVSVDSNRALNLSKLRRIS